MDRVISTAVYALVAIILLYTVYSFGKYVANEDVCKSKGGVYIDDYCIDKSAVIELNKQESNE